MTELVYHVVEHDGGWAYKVGETYSETFPTHEAAHKAAARAAGEQRVSGETSGISYETSSGKWVSELEPGDDRPDTKIDD